MKSKVSAGAGLRKTTLPRLQQLANGLGVELGEFMDKVAEFEKSSKG